MGDIVRVVRKGKFIGWYVRYRDADGKRKMRASHQPSKDQARRFLLEIEGRIARGLLGMPEPTPPAPSVSELVEEFLGKYSRPKIKDLDRYRMHARVALQRAMPIIGTQRSDAISAVALSHLRESLLREVSGGSARQTLTYLATCFAWAVREKRLPTNPLRGIEKPQQGELVEYLSATECKALLATAEQRAATGGPAARMLHACVAVALFCGLRKGELFGLRWLDIDFATRRLTVARSYRSTPKGGRKRHLRLPAVITPVLSAWAGECPRTADGLVFPVLLGGRAPRLGHHDDMLDLPELVASAGCRPLQRAFHALRHTFASHYIMQGGNILALQKILGHSDIKMTMIYAPPGAGFPGRRDGPPAALAFLFTRRYPS